MTAFDHALKWHHGEMIVGGATMAFGLILVVCGALLWKFGASPAARATVAPLVVLGAAVAVISAVLLLNNVFRLEAFQQAHALDPSGFAEREIARVQGFMDWYRYTIAGGAFVVIGGLAVFLLRDEPLAKAIGLAAIVLGATALHIDFFSKALSTRYLADLTALVASGGPPAPTRETAPQNGAGS